mgnify:FL=1
MKKAESGGSIAVLVLLIAMFIGVYILLIPPEDRANLLNQTNLLNESYRGKISSSVLLSEEIGILKPLKTDSVKHDIDSVSLFVKEEPKTEDLANTLSIENGFFGESSHSLLFNVDDITNLKDATLFFFVNEGDGDLIITLNGQIVHSSETDGLKNIVLPKNYIRENNELRFKVSRPRINFFGKNRYELSDVKLRKTFEVTNTKEIRTVVLSSTESGDGKLSYLTFCNKLNTGARLRIFVNNKEKLNELIPCVPQRKTLEISKEDLITGDNEFLFDIDKGDYLLNDISLEVKAKEGGAERIKFAVSDNQYKKIQEGDEAILKIDFATSEENKKATINLNDKQFSFNTKDNKFERFVTGFIKKGNNFIEIKPDNEFEVLNLEIRIENK